MRVVVTAAGGFVGTRLCQVLLQQGHEVVGIDERQLPDGVEAVQGRTTTVDLQRTARAADWVIHLEWSGSFRHAAADPAATGAKNFDALYRVIAACEANGSKLLFGSTGIVYGGNLQTPTKEQEDLAPRSFYGAQKRHAEEVVRLAHLKGVRGISARIFNVYGPGATDPAQILPRLIEALKTGSPVRLTGDGGQQRDLVSVHDVAAGLASFLTMEEPTGEAYNLGSGRGISMLDLARLVYQLAGKQEQIEFVPAVPGESRTLIANMERTLATTGFSPQTTLEFGISQVLELAGLRK